MQPNKKPRQEVHVCHPKSYGQVSGPPLTYPIQFTVPSSPHPLFVTGWHRFNRGEVFPRAQPDQSPPLKRPILHTLTTYYQERELTLELTFTPGFSAAASCVGELFARSPLCSQSFNQTVIWLNEKQSKCSCSQRRTGRQEVRESSRRAGLFWARAGHWFTFGF